MAAEQPKVLVKSVQTFGRKVYSGFLAVSSKRGTAIVMPLSRKNVYQDLVPLTSTDFDE